MKKYISMMMTAIIVLSLSSCYTSNRGYGKKGMPPGQEKKIYGKKSAKEFAPGQQKKHKGKKNK